jgi:hypothetical protein
MLPAAAWTSTVSPGASRPVRSTRSATGAGMSSTLAVPASTPSGTRTSQSASAST